jgi:hypothetical protein
LNAILIYSFTPEFKRPRTFKLQIHEIGNWQSPIGNPLDFPYKAPTGKRPNQFLHFQSQQRRR